MKNDGRLGLHSMPHDQVDKEVQQRIRLLRKILLRKGNRRTLGFLGRWSSRSSSLSIHDVSQRIRLVPVELRTMSSESVGGYDLFGCRGVGDGETGDWGEGGFGGLGREELGRVGEERIGLELVDDVRDGGSI